MIYTVTFNPAIDYVMKFPQVRHGGVNRSVGECVFYGGKGINVSVVLSELGVPNTALGFIAEAVERHGEVLVHKTAVLQIREENAQVVGAAGLQGPGREVGGVAALLYGGEHPFSGRLTDILVAVERLAHGGHRDTAHLRNVLHRYQGNQLLTQSIYEIVLLKRFRYSILTLFLNFFQVFFISFRPI